MSSPLNHDVFLVDLRMSILLYFNAIKTLLCFLVVAAFHHGGGLRRAQRGSACANQRSVTFARDGHASCYWGVRVVEGSREVSIAGRGPGHIEDTAHEPKHLQLENLSAGSANRNASRRGCTVWASTGGGTPKRLDGTATKCSFCLLEGPDHRPAVFLSRGDHYQYPCGNHAKGLPPS